MIENLKEQLTLIYEGDPWYGNPVRAFLESANPARVFDSPGYGLHSIAELTAHMIAWREFAEQQLKDEAAPLPDQEQSFDWKRFSSDKKHAWPIMLDRLDSNQQELIALLTRQDNSISERSVPGKPYSLGYLLAGILQHDLYHIGQIAYIDRWSSKKYALRGGPLRYDYRIFPFQSLARQK